MPCSNTHTLYKYTPTLTHANTHLKINFIRFERANVQNLCITLICWIVPHPHIQTHIHTSHTFVCERPNEWAIALVVLLIEYKWGGMGACMTERERGVCAGTERTMVKGGFRVINLISDKVYKHRSPIKSIGVMKRRKLKVLIFFSSSSADPLAYHGISWTKPMRA